MPGLVEDKVVIVSGAGRGIGRAIALEMAREGAKVVVNDLGTSLSGEGADAGPAAEVVEEIRAAGGEAVANGDSVADWDSAHRIVQCAIDNFGRVDAVVNNAGILRDKFFWKLTEDDWQSVLNVHLGGAFFLSRAAAPYFKEQGGGAFVHMTSNTGLVGNLGQANYAAAKSGMVGLSKSIALEMQRYNVRSNLLSPAAFSRMLDSMPQETEEQKARVNRYRCSLDSTKLGPLAVFLVSDAAKDVTGQIFYVRGNEIHLFSQSRPIRSLHRGEGWTPATIAEQALPAFKASLVPLTLSRELFDYEPI